MNKDAQIIPGTIVWIAPFYNRTGFGVGARTNVIALHNAGARIRVISVNQVEAGIDDCDLTLIKSLESTPVIPPVTAIISHVPSRHWLKIKLPEPNVRILATTVFDCCAEDCAPPTEMLEVCRKMDQIWLHVAGEQEAFMSAGFPPDMVKTVIWPHQWLENPMVPPPIPEPPVEGNPFRFLNISLFLPRRRWDSLIEAYLAEFKGTKDVELYLKVSYPSWHPIPGKPKKDLLDLVSSLRRKTGSEASIIIDEELGTRSSIIRLIDSCNVYISTDTASTAPVSEARVRQRMVVMPEGLQLGMPNEWYVAINADPNAKTLLTQDMLLYQPNHRGSSMPLLRVQNVRKAMRRAYDMSSSERQAKAAKAACLLGPKETVPTMISAINAGWQYKRVLEREREKRATRKRIVWEGSQFIHHSLALVNRELCLQLIDAGHELCLIPYEPDQFGPEVDTRFHKLSQRILKPLSKPVDIHVRHQWPPNFDPPKEGHWVMIQPWEYGSLPKKWIEPMRNLVDEVWVPSNFVRESYIKSGIPEERVCVISNGVSTDMFNPGAAPLELGTDKKFKFLFVGGTIWRKGPEILLYAYFNAFNAHDDVCLVIKDMGVNSFYKGQDFSETIQMMQSNPDAPEILYLSENLAPGNLPGLYTSCDCLVHPYRGEGFGLPIAEAMACGLPVIITEYGAALDFCSNENAYLISALEKRSDQRLIGKIETVDYPWFAEPDREHLAKLMRHVYEHPEEALQKGRCGRIYAEKNLKWSDVSRKVQERIRDISLKPIRRLYDKTLGSVYSQNSRIRDASLKQPIETSIIVSISNQQKYIKRCIESIKKHTDKSYETIFVDNGYSKGVSKWLRSVVNENPFHKLVEITQNAGLAKCYNAGIKASSGEFLILMHNDVVVPEDGLSGMLECLKNDSGIGIVGPMTNKADGIQKDIAADYPSIENLEEYAKAFRKRNRHRLVPTKNVAGYCCAFKRDLVEEIGLFDEEIVSEQIMIEDFCLRARLDGYKNIVASDVFIHHYDSHKVGAGKKCGPIARDRKFLLGKKQSMAAQSLKGKKIFALTAIEQAGELCQRDQIKDAFDVLMDAVRRAPDEKEICYALTELLIDAKKYDDACKVVDAMPSDEREVRRLELTGYCKEGMELYDEAEAYTEQVLAINPNSASALNLKGMLAYRKGDEKTAEDWFNRAIESDTSYGEPYANLGFMRWAAGKEDEALEYFERGFILTPTITDILKNYHAAVKAMGKYERAESVFRQASALYPINKRIKYLFIDVLSRLGKQHDAMKEIEDAIEKFGVDEGVICAALEVRKSVGPHEKINNSVKRGSVSLCMIVKNEEAQLVRCLMNLKPIVDEMIVVDTGSTDRTKDIAAIYGAKVYDFVWTDDFSEARNFSISNASGDWIFVMDADEIISPSDFDEFRKIISRRPSKAVAYSFVTRNYNVRRDIIGLNSNDGMYEEESGVGWVPSQKVRLFTNSNGILFEYPVHEIVEPFLKRKNIEIKMSKIPVHHYGHMREDKRTFKGEGYYNIGKKKLDEMGSDDVVAIQELAVQAGMLEKWDDAANLWHMFIRLRPDKALAFVNLGTAYQNMGRYADAMSAAGRAMKLDPNMKEAFHDYALYNLFSGDAKEAVVVLEALVRRFSDYQSAQFKLAVAYLCAGRTGDGIKWLERLWSTPIERGLAISCYTMAKKLFDIGRYQYARAVLEGAVRGQHVNEDVISLLNQCRKAEEAAFTEPEDIKKGKEAAMHA